ncbi:MAG TPA: peptidoglycan DD-metalloendopeptidase family protein [Steroidobacteraceae bacterium]|jgi:murein DD-endopeptidase MepM/ murein hydrolase activator NlpD|nr:peptidoglycan DD-metalloendopeptidase family protein [Steroidobacteraceae bacterium]
MNVIFVGRKSGRVKQFDLRHPFIVAAALLLVVGIVGGAFSVGVGLGVRHGNANPINQLGNWSAILLRQQAQLEDVKRNLQEKVNALAMRVGQMNANVIRVNALGKRLTHMAKLNDGEFDFGNPPALGGSDSGTDGQPAQIPNLTAMVDDLQSQLSSREQQLGVLENLILTRELNRQVYPEGRPVQDGWISSYFGRRADPFTGYSAVHKGLDFAGAEGTKVSTVAAGLVTFAGERSGFGQMVEVNHGNGLATRYCHNERVLVKQGDMVRKGQEIALMGSTGHSTGPHLHFEVLKNGAQVDPLRFIGEDR